MNNINTINIEGIFNILGWPITTDQIEGIINPKTSDDRQNQINVSAFFEFDSKSLHHKLLERYAKACSSMKPIIFGTVHDKIYDRAFYSLISAKKCYSFDQTVACIEMCALFSEMLCIYLCVVHKNHLMSEGVKTLIKEKEQKLYEKIKNDKNPIDLFDSLLQPQRIKWLNIAELINEEEIAYLNNVHKQRKQYFHHWTKQLNETDNDALSCLRDMSHIAYNHLELFKKPVNIKKVKEYIKNFQQK